MTPFAAYGVNEDETGHRVNKMISTFLEPGSKTDLLAHACHPWMLPPFPVLEILFQHAMKKSRLVRFVNE